MLSPLVQIEKVSKSFGANRVLTEVSLNLMAGEVHVLAGGNGAGKSTLINILGASLTDYEGALTFDGRRIRFSSPLEASKGGISVVHQELSLIPSMSVVENLFLGEMRRVGPGFLDWKRMKAEAQIILNRLQIRASLDAPVEALPIATQQLIEIGKALRHEARLVILDEPTSALNSQETDRLFDLIGELREKGCAILYVSHRMEEYSRIADRVSVLRDGRIIETRLAADWTPDEIARAMVAEGAKALESEARGAAQGVGNDLLSVTHLSARQGRKVVVEDVSLELKTGEVVGLAGLEGSGASELLWTLFGAGRQEPGLKVKLNGNGIDTSSPCRSIAEGVGLVTNDRKANGLILHSSVRENLILPSLSRFTSKGFISNRQIRQAGAELCHAFGIKAESPGMPVGELSGGNQQKVVLAKWRHSNPQVLLLDEPTRGIDVNAKQEVYRLIGEWKAQGLGILVHSSDIHELIDLCDRILVMRQGRIAAEFKHGEASPEAVIQAAVQA
jgi:ribose transport system ATP-binding protein